MSNSASSLPEDQLLELLIQLQKTTPEQAKAILNAQPQIGYALVPLMAKAGVINLEVVQKTLASYASQNQTLTSAPTPQSVPTPVPPAVPAIPSHISQAQAQTQPPYGHQPTPPPVNPAVPPAATYQGAPPAVSGNGYPGYPQTQNGGYAAQGQYGQPYGQQYGASGQQQQQQQQHWNSQQQQAPASGAPGGAGMLGNLANIPEDQREMIMRVISMTPEQIRSLPPQERTITVQLRSTLGLPAE